MNRAWKKLTGQRFGRLTILDFGKRDKHDNVYLACKCECGNACIVSVGNLRSGKTKSCGCITKYRLRTHGLSRTVEYPVWSQMIRRCHNPITKCFPNYGGRGIEVCSRWRNSFLDFLSDMGKRPSDSHTIERVNNGGHYCPENCIWATRSQQADNRKVTHKLKFNGQEKSSAQWSRELGIPYKLIKSRVDKGWEASRILTTPKMINGSTYATTH